MATLCRWGLETLDRLPVPKDKWRLDLLLEQLPQNSRRAKFESPDACWREDVRRAHALRRLPSIYEHIAECNPLEVATSLSEAAKSRRIERCAASAAYMRDRRLALLGATLQLVDEHPPTEMAFVSISHIGWYLTPHYNWRILSQLSEHVADFFKDGPFSEPGFFIGFISARYEPAANNIQLYLKGLCAGEKVRSFRHITGGTHQANFYYELGLWEVKNLARQIPAIMPRSITETAENVNQPDRRMREPYHSVYLMWLACQSLSPLVITNDLAVDRQHGLIIAPYPPDTETDMPSFQESSMRLDASGKVDWSRFGLAR